ncbi:MAG: signal peptidase [Streptosporangiaceae bacterium]|nr:signal peptidase [Streptosporangiaceae bacterium]
MAGPADAGPAGGGPAGGRPRRRRRRVLAETAVTILVAVLLAGLVRAFAFQTFWIPSPSMVPTLSVYDRILVQKAFVSWRDVREGDIVVFSHPPLDHCGGPQEGDLVKRVIALPGQTIYSSGNSIYVDGRLLAEPYLPRYDPLGPPMPHASRQHPYRVPPGEFYLLGDNRAISCDSRYWGPIKGSIIIGKVVLVLWHDHHPDFRRF